MTNEAKFLSLHFAGYFMARLATDPDPTDDLRGTSGYTMALHGEHDLDQRIYLQREWINKEEEGATKLRAPATDLAIKIGVEVKNVTYDGKPYDNADKFIGARVNLVGSDANAYNTEGKYGPTFVSRNNVVGSDDTLAFIVEPFIFTIEKDLNNQDDNHQDTQVKEARENDDSLILKISATDHLDPADPIDRLTLPSEDGKPSWKIDQPGIYTRRLPIPSSIVTQSKEAHQAIGVYDEYGYFKDRRRWLTEQITKIEKQESLSNDQKVELQGYKSRLFQLEAWGDRVINKLGFLTQWDFLINGDQQVCIKDGDQQVCINNIDCKENIAYTKKSQDVLGGEIITNQRWPVRFWFGGWDGDLLTGYMRGTLDLPFRKSS